MIGIILLLSEKRAYFGINDRLLIIGDGIKVCKEAKKTPGVKRLHQDSVIAEKVNTFMATTSVMAVFLSETKRSPFAFP
jgi:hypothetical protein